MVDWRDLIPNPTLRQIAARRAARKARRHAWADQNWTARFHKLLAADGGRMAEAITRGNALLGALRSDAR